MLTPLIALLALQVQAGGAPDSAAIAAAEARRDSICAAEGASGRQSRFRCTKRRVEVTPRHLATAFASPRARSLLEAARAARLRQDSSLASYDATAYQRFSVGLSLRETARHRLFYRNEQAARIRWARGVGALVDVTGARSASPVVDVATDPGDVDFRPIPYFPGREVLWLGSGRVAQAEVDPEQFVHPIARGAEAYYRYAVGDSVIVRLPGGRSITLRELIVEPRRPQWNLVAGSFWFDVASSQLVRAVYRPAVPLDIWQAIEEEEEDEDVPGVLRGMMTPMIATVEAVAIEHGLYEGRYWLPRAQRAEGRIRAGLARAPFALEQRFEYASVNGDLDTLATLFAVVDSAVAQARADSAAADSAAATVNVGITVGERGDTTRRSPRERAAAAELARRQYRNPRAQCALSDDSMAVVRARGYKDSVPRIVRIPCDTARLARSPALPGSIYDEGEELFARAELEELAAGLGFGTQAAWSPQPIRFFYGLEDGLLRYNRIEGLSAGIGVRQMLGRGYSWEARAQIGTADLEPNGSLMVMRGSGTRSVHAGVYRRLVAVSEWGDPFSLGSSLNALLFARDEAFYYRAWGAEVGGTGGRESTLSWRAFAERHESADVETQFSLAHAINDVEFLPNITAEAGEFAGVGARWIGSRGIDPRGLRLLADLRGEVAVGEFGYARGALDVTAAHPLTRGLDGALTLGAGSSAGELPPQRLWYLGGSPTIRGQQLGAAVGNAYWMARTEVGTSFVLARPVVFYDIGWAGARAEFGETDDLLSGVGAGVSFLDGMVRFDVARGLEPEQQWRADLYFEARF